MTDMNQFVRLLSQEEFLKEQWKAAEILRERARENEVVISVIGQFKRGKSSLINAMLKDEILPVGIIPLTTVVTEIRQADTFRAAVCFTDGSTKEIKKEELEDYCSEQKNQGNHKKVETVKLWIPDHPFQEGVVLVDTPGVGSVHQHNTDSSYAYLEQSDAIIFLLSVDSPVSETEREFLLKAGEYASKFFFAVNKIDTVSPEDFATFQEFCTKVIEESMDRRITLYGVSAKTGRGIDELTKALKNELKSSHNRLLEESVEKKVDIIKGQAKAKLRLSLKTSALPAEELQKKLANIRQRQEELKGFAEEVQVLARHRTDVLVDEIKDDFEKECLLIERRSEEKCTALYKEYENLSTKDFEKSLQNALDQYLEEELNALNQKGILRLETGYEKIVGILNDKAVEVAFFISRMLKEEFELDYPVNVSSFQVSKKSDFLMHIGARGTLLLDMNEIARLLPKKMANKRFYQNSLKQAKEDIEKNKNNMLYNYRYKMKESLRVLCFELSGKVESMAQELHTLVTHIEGSFDVADRQRQQEEDRLIEMIEKIEAL